MVGDMTLAHTPADSRDLLRSAGLRVTNLRLSALDLVEANPHATADLIFGELQQQHEGTSIQATYNVLNDLHGAGLLRRIEPAGSPARFERRIDDNHHHLICRNCGDLRDIDCAVGEAPCLAPSDTHGFILDEAEVVYWGLCPSCQTTTSTTTTTH